jgi:ethanolamine ammonia-lyase small subunit
VTLPDPWQPLRRLTAARIALGRAGSSLPTGAHLDFQLAHAAARDAVRHRADLEAIAAALAVDGRPALLAASAARDLEGYLHRPDLGRRLAPESAATLAAAAAEGPWDLALVVTDGLSGLAVERHAAPLASRVASERLAAGWRVAPVVVVRHGRVALGDEIGEALGARLVAVLIGERPGLSAPDSLGIYVTWAPRKGRTDAERNCISNVRAEGMPVPDAARKLAWLLDEARRRELTGVALKDVAPSGGALRPGEDAR